MYLIIVFTKSLNFNMIGSVHCTIDRQFLYFSLTLNTNNSMRAENSNNDTLPFYGQIRYLAEISNDFFFGGGWKLCKRLSLKKIKI